MAVAETARYVLYAVEWIWTVVVLSVIPSQLIQRAQPLANGAGRGDVCSLTQSLGTSKCNFGVRLTRPHAPTPAGTLARSPNLLTLRRSRGPLSPLPSLPSQLRGNYWIIVPQSRYQVMWKRSFSDGWPSGGLLPFSPLQL